VEVCRVAEDSGGFLGRWSRRKTVVLQGKPVVEPGLEPVVMAKRVPSEPADEAFEPEIRASTPEPAPLSLEDARLLTKDSDFKPFMVKGVGTDVRNAAMKKLFTDPHFNVMDGLDIYIDDYSKSDPIPEAMLRQMTSAKVLGLFDEDDDDEKSDEVATPRENANNPTSQTVAQSYERADIASTHAKPQINPSQSDLLPDGSNAVASQRDHDNPDLRLQPDYAAPASEAGRGT
jgi:hypothetical protein